MDANDINRIAQATGMTTDKIHRIVKLREVTYKLLEMAVEEAQTPAEALTLLGAALCEAATVVGVDQQTLQDKMNYLIKVHYMFDNIKNEIDNEIEESK